jgi:hypothetical protein
MKLLLGLAVLAAGGCACPAPRTRCGAAGLVEVCASGAWLPVGRCAEAGDGWRCIVADAGVAACLPP